MCGWRLFHKWGPYVDGFVTYKSFITGDVKYRHAAQKRICKRCFKAQVKKIEL